MLSPMSKLDASSNDRPWLPDMDVIETVPPRMGISLSPLPRIGTGARRHLKVIISFSLSPAAAAQQHGTPYRRDITEEKKVERIL